ncbi:MAG: hypothetical protein MUC96_24090 [Myxococcaceae bacterium]|jgi:hypothetical protein|nr:hypothetical protein [Myxococcaceae bacterium]
MLTVLTCALLSISPSTSSARLLDQPTLLAQSNFFPPSSGNPRVDELEAEIFRINQDLAQLKSFWPVGTMAMCIAGGILAPLALLGLVTIFIPFIGLPLLVLGGGGIALLVYGLMTGFKHDEQVKQRRAELTDRRNELEREVRDLKRRAAGAMEAPVLLTLATF